MAMERKDLAVGSKKVAKRYIGSRLVWEGFDKVYGKTFYSIAIRDSEIEFKLTAPDNLYMYEFNDKYPYYRLVKVTIAGKLVGRPEFRISEGDNYFVEFVTISNDNRISAPDGAEVIMYFKK